MKKILKMTLITFIMLIGMNSVGANACYDIDNLTDCRNSNIGCIWNNGICKKVGAATDCRDILNRDDCRNSSLGNGCIWKNNVCENIGSGTNNSSNANTSTSTNNTSSTNNSSGVISCSSYNTEAACVSTGGKCIWSNLTCRSVNNIETVKCGDTTGIPKALPVFSSNIVTIIKIVVPILLVILGMIDFAKAMMSNDDKAMKESQNKFVKRLIGGVAVFLVIAVIQFIFNVIGTESTNAMASCINCFLNNSCSTSNQLDLCKIQAHKNCSNNCYNATGSYSSSGFYSCVTTCEYTNYDKCELRYGTGFTEKYYCLKCKSDDSKYFWVNQNLNTNVCPNGYEVTALTKEECYEKSGTKFACYQCQSDSSLYQWAVDSQASTSPGGGCVGNYKKVDNITKEADCHA